MIGKKKLFAFTPRRYMKKVKKKKSINEGYSLIKFDIKPPLLFGVGNKIKSLCFSL